MSLSPDLDKFLFSLLGALIGGSVVAWTTGYFSEKGKQLARDINKVLEETRKVTKETAAINAEISGGQWRQQWQLTQRRDLYVRLISALENLRLQRGNARQGRADAKQEQEAVEEFRSARALARLLLPAAVIEAMRGLLRSIGESSDTAEGFRASQQMIGVVRDRVVQLAKLDLGITEEGTTKGIASSEKQ